MNQKIAMLKKKFCIRKLPGPRKYWNQNIWAQRNFEDNDNSSDMRERSQRDWNFHLCKAWFITRLLHSVS